MTNGKNLIAGLILLLINNLGAFAAGAGANDNHGKEWRQLTETKGLTWTQVSQVCPRNGAAPCNGAVGNNDLSGWIWATQTQVVEFFGYYEPAMLTSSGVSGQQYFFSASSFLSVIHPTFSFANTYATGDSTGGWTATTDAAGLPTAGAVSTNTTPVSINGAFSIGAVTDPANSSDRGVFLWRSTGAGTGTPVANDDAGQVLSPAGGLAVANVLANDWMNGAGATTANVVLTTVSSTNPGVTLDVTDGSVDVSPGTSATTHTLLYRICALNNPSSCAGAAVRVTVPPYVVVANNDQGTASPSTGGSAVANVLTNDFLGSTRATISSIVLTQVSTSNPGVTLDVTDGSVDVARGTVLGAHSLLYKICERVNPTNCDEASVAVTVQAYVINAVDDSARASSKTGGTAITSVLRNDLLGNAVATSANVKLALVSAPAKGITLNLNTGAVTVAPKTSSGLYSFAYRICELADLSNCDQATVTLDLSGRSP